MHRHASSVALLALGLFAIGGCRRVAAVDAAFDDANRPDAYRGDTGLVGFDGGQSVGPGCNMDYSNCPTVEDRLCYASSSIGFQPMSTYYFPQCIRIFAGSTVHIMASDVHPLVDAACSPTTSPLPDVAVTRTAVLGYVFNEPGRYGFFSPGDGLPDGTGMAGLIIVDPVPDASLDFCFDSGTM